MPSMTKEQLEQSGIADSKTVCNLRCSCQTRTQNPLSACVQRTGSTDLPIWIERCQSWWPTAKSDAVRKRRMRASLVLVQVTCVIEPINAPKVGVGASPACQMPTVHVN